MELARWRFILAIVAFSSFWNTNEREMQNKFWNIYTAVVVQASLISNLSLQNLALHLEIYEVAADQEQSQCTISFFSHFLEYLPLSGAHHFTPLLVLNNHHNLCKHREHSKIETSIFFFSKLNQTE